MFCKECMCSIEKTHTKKMSNRIRSGLTDESKSLYEAYKCKYSSSPFDDGTIESGNSLIDKMTEEKRKRWEEVITSTNMTHNSHKAWKMITKLFNDTTTFNPPCLVSAN